MNAKTSTPRHIIMKRKPKAKSLESTKRKVTHQVQWFLKKLTDLSSETLETRRQWADMLCAERKIFNQESYICKMGLQSEGEMKTFSGKQR